MRRYNPNTPDAANPWILRCWFFEQADPFTESPHWIWTGRQHFKNSGPHYLDLAWWMSRGVWPKAKVVSDCPDCVAPEHLCLEEKEDPDG